MKKIIFVISVLSLLSCGTKKLSKTNDLITKENQELIKSVKEKDVIILRLQKLLDECESKKSIKK